MTTSQCQVYWEKCGIHVLKEIERVNSYSISFNFFKCNIYKSIIIKIKKPIKLQKTDVKIF